MHLKCPHCQTLYDIARDGGDALFVCHQCGQEFSAPAVSSDRGDIVLIEAEQAPVRSTAHIWPWLLMILIVLATTGFWVQKDAWLDNRWLRSSLINIGFNMAQRGKDWRIDPASIQSEWLSRDDGSRVLRIRGSISNLLDSDLPLPAIRIVFFSKTEPAQSIGSVVLKIRHARPDDQVQRFLYITALRDSSPVSALGNRNFTIVAESVPAQTGDFTVAPVPL